MCGVMLSCFFFFFFFFVVVFCFFVFFFVGEKEKGKGTELKRSSFRFEADASGRRFATMAHDEVTKNHPGGVSGVLTNEKLARVYDENENDGYKAMKLYISKLNPKSDAFFQYPKKQWNYDDEVWYDARPIGVNKLDNMMKSIREAAKLSKMKCSPTTALGPLRSPCGQMPESKIAILWQYLVTVVSSLADYNTRPSTSQLHQ